MGPKMGACFSASPMSHPSVRIYILLPYDGLNGFFLFRAILPNSLGAQLTRLIDWFIILEICLLNRTFLLEIRSNTTWIFLMKIIINFHSLQQLITMFKKLSSTGWIKKSLYWSRTHLYEPHSQNYWQAQQGMCQKKPIKKLFAQCCC